MLSHVIYLDGSGVVGVNHGFDDGVVVGDGFDELGIVVVVGFDEVGRGGKLLHGVGGGRVAFFAFEVIGTVVDDLLEFSEERKWIFLGGDDVVAEGT